MIPPDQIETMVMDSMKVTETESKIDFETTSYAVLLLFTLLTYWSYLIGYL